MKKKEYKELVEFQEQAIAEKNNSLLRYEQTIRELRKEIETLKQNTTLKQNKTVWIYAPEFQRY